MGRTKLYTEPETYNTQEYRTVNSQVRTRKSIQKPVTTGSGSYGESHSGSFLQVLHLGIRRNWVAFRFQFHRYTFGAFVKQAGLKLVFLGGAAYAMLFYEGSDLNTSNSGLPEGVAMETSLEYDAKPRKKAAKASKKPVKNDVAPVSAGDMEGSSAEVFIQKYAKIAVGEMKRYGVPASISLAQGLIESRAGQSTLARENNNFFGMKCFLRNCPRGHCTNHTDDSHKDFFRKYKTAWEGWRAHSMMISTGRYAKLKKYGYDYRKWAYGLKNAGYATDRTYAEKLIGVIDRYDLNRFDH